MAETINCNTRTEKGTGAARKMRRQGLIPGIVYGHKTKPISITVSETEFLKTWRKITGKQILLDLVVHKNDKKTKMHGFLKEYQHDPVDRKFLHLDFHKVSTSDKIRMAIPIEVTGEAPGEKQGGIVDQILREIEVEGLAGKLPEKITVDISALEIGDSIFVSSLKLTDEIEILKHGEEPIVSVLAPKKVEEEVAAPVALEETAAAEPEVISEKTSEERRKKKEESTPREEGKAREEGKPKEEKKK